MRVALVIVWLGPWKPWINLYVESCRRNPSFDFLIYTDQAPPSATAANVRFLPIDRESMEQRIWEKLHLRTRLPKAYKLCDYKALFGLLFAEELEMYSHWGYCDEDLLWGRLDHFVPRSLLATHDIVTSCRCCIVGQLTIFKNVERVNRLALRVPDYATFLLSPRTEYLDETLLDKQARIEEAAGILKVWRRQIQIHDEHDEAWSRWANEIELRETGRPLGPLKHGNAIWRNGAVYHAASGEEFAFFHFKKWKKRWKLPLIPPVPAAVTEWQLTADGIRFLAPPPTSRAAHLFIARHQRRVLRERVERSVRQQWNRGGKVLDRIRRGLARRLPALSGR